MLWVTVFALLMGASCGYALISGGPSERWAAAATIIAAIASALVAHPAPQLWQGTESGIFIIDSALLATFAAIAVFSNRFWPIWTTAFQFLTVLAHFGPVVRNAHIAIPFAFEEEVWSYVILAQLIFVTHSHRNLAIRIADRPSQSFSSMQHR